MPLPAIGQWPRLAAMKLLSLILVSAVPNLDWLCPTTQLAHHKQRTWPEWPEKLYHALSQICMHGLSAVSNLQDLREALLCSSICCLNTLSSSFMFKLVLSLNTLTSCHSCALQINSSLVPSLDLH